MSGPMCDTCAKLISDPENTQRIQSIYSRIEGRLANTKAEPNGEEIAFSTNDFPLLTGMVFEPRMQLQLPSNFYQSVIIDGQKLRSDWAGGWMRVVGFEGDSLFLLAQAMRTHDGKEYIVYLHKVEFRRGEFSVNDDGNRITVSVKDVKKEGINLLNGQPASHTYSFTFIHQPTERSMVPRDRIEGSALIKTIYHGAMPQKPLTFDWTTYVVTVPHLAPYHSVHQRFKDLGYAGAMDMQNAVTGMLRQHLSK